jgi:hypothetical protein
VASSVAADQVVVLRNTAPRGNPPYVTGTLFDVGRGERVRNAGVRVAQLRDLMLYLFTGKPDIVAEEHRPEVVAPPSAPAAAEPAPAATERATSPAAGGSKPITGYVFIGLGAALAATGVVVATAGTAADRSTLAGLTDGTGRFSDTDLANTTMGKIATTNAVAFTLVGLGAGSVLGGVLAMVLFPNAPATVAIVPTASGGVLSVGGAF